MEDSPSKLSVAELAGRFKGHILATPAARDESPRRRRPPCSLRLPIGKQDAQETHPTTNGTVSTSPPKIRMKNSAIIERLQANLALSPSTLLPPPRGTESNPQPDSPPLAIAAPAIASPLSPARLSAEEEDREEAVSFESPPEGARLTSFHKTRVRLSFKRRPPTRQHRRSTGEEAELFGGTPPPCELRSPEANGDVVLQCPDRVARKERRGDVGDGAVEEGGDCEERRIKTPQEEDEETREEEGQPQTTDGGDADLLH